MPTQTAAGFTEKPAMPSEADSQTASNKTTMNYAAHVVKPEIDATITANPFSLVTTLRDNVDYAFGSLLRGEDCQGKAMTLGNRRFVQSGQCDHKTSVPQCHGKPRYLYVDNVPSRVMPCVDTSQPYDPKCDKGGTGMMTGMVQDILHINPFELLSSAMGNGSVVNNKCVLRTELVGTVAGDKEDLHSETRCAPERKPLVCSLQLSGDNCHVYSKRVDAQREFDGDVVDVVVDRRLMRADHTYTTSTAAEAAFEVSPHMSEAQKKAFEVTLLTQLSDHAQRSVAMVTQQHAERNVPKDPENVLRWVEFGETRLGRPVLALYNDTLQRFVSEVGVVVPVNADAAALVSLTRRMRSWVACSRDAETCALGASTKNFRDMLHDLARPLLLNAQPATALTVREHNNATIEVLLERLLAENALQRSRPPTVLKEVTVNKYNPDWRKLVTTTVPPGQAAGGGVHEMCNRTWHSMSVGDDGVATERDGFTLVMACCKRIAQCSSNFMMYEWISTIRRPRRTYGYQILWRAYRNRFVRPEMIYLTHASVIGNPNATDVPPLEQPTTWDTVEGFVGSVAASSSTVATHRDASHKSLTATMALIALIVVMAVVVVAARSASSVARATMRGPTRLLMVLVLLVLLVLLLVLTFGVLTGSDPSRVR